MSLAVSLWLLATLYDPGNTERPSDLSRRKRGSEEEGDIWPGKGWLLPTFTEHAPPRFFVILNVR